MKKIIFLTALFSLLQPLILGGFHSYGKNVEAIARNTQDGIELPIAGIDTEVDEIFQTEENRGKEDYHCCGTGKNSVQTAERFYSQLFLDGGTDPYTGKYYPPGNKDGSTDPYTGKFYPQGDEQGRIDPYTGRYYPRGNEDGRTVPKTERPKGGRR